MVGGVSTIEPVNKVIVPTLLAIIVFSFYWALFLPYSADGIIYMFKPNWGKLVSCGTEAGKFKMFCPHQN